jgi:hypothetical protein
VHGARGGAHPGACDGGDRRAVRYRGEKQGRAPPGREREEARGPRLEVMGRPGKKETGQAQEIVIPFYLFKKIPKGLN